jgi:hypothetical protein
MPSSPSLMRPSFQRMVAIPLLPMQGAIRLPLANINTFAWTSEKAYDSLPNERGVVSAAYADTSKFPELRLCSTHH